MKNKVLKLKPNIYAIANLKLKINLLESTSKL